MGTAHSQNVNNELFSTSPDPFEGVGESTNPVLLNAGLAKILADDPN